MDIHILREAQARFESKIKSLKDSKVELYALRKSFVKYFNLQKLHNLQIDDYVLGREKPHDGHSFNFCYGLETQLKNLGWMIGGTSFKFGFYYGVIETDKVKKFRYVKRFGNTPEQAIKIASNLIIDLLQQGQRGDTKAIIRNGLSPMFKGKILTTYYPDKYLDVFAASHLDHFLKHLHINYNELVNQSEVIKREKILEFRDSDPVMKNWDIDIYTDFLYELFGRPEENEPKTDPLKEYRKLDFPLKQFAEEIYLNIAEFQEPDPPKDKRKANSKPDYEKQNRRNKELGEIGEKIVEDFEKARLIKLGKPNLAKKINRVSTKSDSIGYDILSYNEDGTERYIEVKATRSKVGNANFFLTINELNTAREKENYYIYMVYEVLSEKPRIWIIPNPFSPANEKVNLAPINYKVTINVEYNR